MNQSSATKPAGKKKKKSQKVIKPYLSIRHLNLPQEQLHSSISITINNEQSEYKIIDCESKVTLTQYYRGRRRNVHNRQNAVFKLQSMIEELTKARDYLVSEFERNNLRYNKTKLNLPAKL